MEEVETRKLKETSSGYKNKQVATVGNGGEGVHPTGDPWDTVQSTMHLSHQRNEDAPGTSRLPSEPSEQRKPSGRKSQGLAIRSHQE